MAPPDRRHRLGDGVGELETTAAFEVYSQSSAAGTVALAAGDTVRTRHGLVLLTTSYANAPGYPGRRAGHQGPRRPRPKVRALAQDQDLNVEPFQGGFNAALQNLAGHTDAATASTTAMMIGYPTTGLHLGQQHGSWRPVLLAITAVMLAVLVGLTPTFLVRRRRRRASTRQSSRRQLRQRLGGGPRWRERHGMKLGSDFRGPIAHLEERVIAGLAGFSCARPRSLPAPGCDSFRRLVWRRGGVPLR